MKKSCKQIGRRVKSIFFSKGHKGEMTPQRKPKSQYDLISFYDSTAYRSNIIQKNPSIVNSEVEVLSSLKFSQYQDQNSKILNIKYPFEHPQSKQSAKIQNSVMIEQQMSCSIGSSRKHRGNRQQRRQKIQPQRCFGGMSSAGELIVLDESQIFDSVSHLGMEWHNFQVVDYQSAQQIKKWHELVNSLCDAHNSPTTDRLKLMQKNGHLDLSHMNLTLNNSLDKMLQYNVTNLKTIDFTNCGIPTQGWQTISSSITKFFSLAWLDLKNNHIQLIKNGEMKNFQRSRSFKYLNLVDNRLNQKNVSQLEQVKYSFRVYLRRDQSQEPNNKNLEIVNTQIPSKMRRTLRRLVQYVQSITTNNPEIRQLSVESNKKWNEEVQNKWIKLIIKHLEKAFRAKIKEYHQHQNFILNSNQAKTIDKQIIYIKTLSEKYLKRLQFQRYPNNQQNDSNILGRRKILEKIIKNLQYIFRSDGMPKKLRYLKRNTIIYQIVIQMRKGSESQFLRQIQEKILDSIGVLIEEDDKFETIGWRLLILGFQIIQDLMNIFNEERKMHKLIPQFMRKRIFKED